MLDAAQSAEMLRDRQSEISAQISEKMQLAPVRALSVAAGQIFQTAIGGRGEILARAGKARNLLSRAGEATTAYRTQETALRQTRAAHLMAKSGTVGVTGSDSMFEGATLAEAQAKKDKETARLWEERKDQAKAVKALKTTAEARTAKAATAAENILSPMQMLRAQAAGTVGIVAGTMAFTAAMAAAQAAMEQIGKAADNAADRMLGFARTAATVSTQMAGAIQGAGGNVAAVNQSAGQVGAVGSLQGLQMMAGREAALQNMRASIDLYRSDRWARNNGLMGQTGSVRGIGNNMGNGLVPGTFLDWISSTPGAIEQLSGSFGPGGPIEKQISPSLLGATVTGPGSNFDPIKSLQTIGVTWNPFTSTDQKMEELNKLFGLDGKETKGVIDRFNENVDKAGKQFGKLDVSASKEELDAFNKALREAGASEGVAASYTDRGIVGRDATGQVISSSGGVNRLFGGFLQGQLMPTSSELFEGQKRGLQAQIGQMYNQQALQQQLSIPAQFAQNLLSNPLASSSAVGILPTGMTAPADLLASFSEYGPRIKGVRDQLSDLQADGMKAMEALAPNEAQRKQLQGLTGDIKALSEESRTLAEANVGAQLALSEAEYANQLRLAKRSLGDALGLEGKKTALVGDQVVKATRLGELQRQQVMVSRQSEQLSLQMNQRELNFAIALSRINTPGSTPIERATRAREQELLNRDRQRQQDYAEQGFGLGKAIQNIEFSRSTIDQIKSLGLMLQGRDLEIQIRNTQPLIEANNQLISYKQNLVSSITETGTSMKQLRITALAEIQAASGDFSDETAKMVDQQVSDMSEKWKGFFAGLVAAAPPIPGTGTTVSPSTSTTPKKGYTYDPESGLYIKDYGATGTPNTNAYASGTVFDAAKGAYSMTVGEAGTEHVAVLRNPRRMPWTQFGGGGGSSSVTINMNGTWSVRSDGDVDAIADSVARRVEERLNRRAAVFASREL